MTRLNLLDIFYIALGSILISRAFHNPLLGTGIFFIAMGFYKFGERK